MMIKHLAAVWQLVSSFSRSKHNYLQIFGDRVRCSVGDHDDGVGLADHCVSNLYLTSLPVSHSCSHGSHSQSSVVWVIELPVPEKIVTFVTYVLRDFYTEPSHLCHKR